MRPVAGVYTWPLDVGYSRPPFANLVAGAGALVAGPNGLTLARFAWVNPQGQASNWYAPGYQLGFALFNYDQWNWQRVYNQAGTTVLRSGQQCQLASIGDFAMRFPQGAIAGSPVWANPSDGTASCQPSGLAAVLDSSGEPVLDSSGNIIYAQAQFIQTKWVAMRNGGCNCLTLASSFAFPFLAPISDSSDAYIRDSAGQVIYSNQ